MPDAFATQYNANQDALCRLCGAHGNLTFEHVPPKRCFNDAPRLLQTVRGLVNQFKTPERFPRGLGVKSLCESCNGWTATHYGRAYAQFVATAMATIGRLEHENTLLLPFTCQALRVAKQMAVMAIAMAGTYTLKKNERFDRLRELVLTPARSGRLNGLHFWTYLMKEGQPRLTSMGVPFMIAGALPFVWCEIALPPLGVVVMNDGHDESQVASLLGLCNVSSFFERHDSWIDTAHLRLRVLKPIGATALQYEDIPGEVIY